MSAAAAPVEILMVEDSPGAVRLTREALRDAGVESRLHVVEDGVAALDFLYCRPPYSGAARPDLVLLDLNLPRKGGAEVLGEIRGDPALSGIPVVVLSTSQAEDDVLRCKALDANCYLVKPRDYEGFVSVGAGLRRFWE